MNITPLTRKHYIDFNGSPPEVGIKGFALEDKGKTYCIVGVVNVCGELFIVFGVKPGFSKRDIIRGWARFERTLDKSKSYYAIIDRDYPTSAGLLEHFNFKHLFDDLYILRG